MTHELKPGWLKRQIAATKKQIRELPEWMRRESRCVAEEKAIASRLLEQP